MREIKTIFLGCSLTSFLKHIRQELSCVTFGYIYFYFSRLYSCSAGCPKVRIIAKVKNYYGLRVSNIIIIS